MVTLLVVLLLVVVVVTMLGYTRRGSWGYYGWGGASILWLILFLLLILWLLGVIR